MPEGTLMPQVMITIQIVLHRRDADQLTQLANWRDWTGDDCISIVCCHFRYESKRMKIIASSQGDIGDIEIAEGMCCCPLG